jgi:hypothetical protein
MKPSYPFTLLVILFLTSCGTFESGRERTFTPNVITLTANALATDNARFSAMVAASATAIRLTAQAASISATPVLNNMSQVTATATPTIPAIAPTDTAMPAPPSQPAPLSLPATATPLPVPSATSTSMVSLTPAVITQANCGDPQAWFFDHPGACPEAPPVYSHAAAQRFEHGEMIWVEAIDAFYLLFDKGFYPSDSRQVFQRVGPLALKPGASKDNRVGETPPAGYYEPVSGFGLIWRNEVENLDTNIRAALGWAREPEFGFNTTLQCEQQQTYSSHTCYLRGPSGKVIELGWGAYVGSVWSER